MKTDFSGKSWATYNRLLEAFVRDCPSPFFRLQVILPSANSAKLVYVNNLGFHSGIAAVELWSSAFALIESRPTSSGGAGPRAATPPGGVALGFISPLRPPTTGPIGYLSSTLSAKG
jgi:hypothetical protein